MPGNRLVIEEVSDRLVHAGAKVGEAIIDRKSRRVVGKARRYAGQVLLDGARADGVDYSWKVRRLRTCTKKVPRLELHDSQAHAVPNVAHHVLVPVALIDGICAHQVR